MPDLRQIVAVALKPVRRGRHVAWTPQFMGIGNLLQLAMWAHDGRDAGEARWIRCTPRLEPWLAVFPGLHNVVLLDHQVRFTDRRVAPWSEAARTVGVDGAVALHEQVDVLAVESFVRGVLLPGTTLGSAHGAQPDDVLVVNVRRGDYYSDPEIRKQYGFDVISYLRAAVAGSVERDGAPPRISVVSDDIAWCRSHLSWLELFAPADFADTGGAVEDFELVSGARRAILSNSTFSYWAAHVSNVIHGDNHAEIWAPRFFDRTQNNGRSWLLDERWSVVEELDGSWDERVGG